MEPREQGLSAEPERTPASAGNYEIGRNPELSELGKEIHNETKPEANDARTEAAQVAMPTLPVPVLPDPQASSDDGASSMPIVANDDDLIEKEWVDKAKKILADTRTDPYRREREISKLQIEYIRRRYGREIGDSGD